MTEITNRKQLHEKAMAYAQEAMLAEHGGEEQKALLLYRKAYLQEKEVAMTFFFDEDKQPTRSILFRSAAELAKNCGEYQEAQKLVSYGLSGNPPVEIIDQLTKLDEELHHLINSNTSKNKSRFPKQATTLLAIDEDQSAHKHNSTDSGRIARRSRFQRPLRNYGRVVRRPGQLLATNQNIQRTGILAVKDDAKQLIQITSRSGSITQIKIPASVAQSISNYEGARVTVKAKKQGKSFVFAGFKPVTITR